MNSLSVRKRNDIHELNDSYVHNHYEFNGKQNALDETEEQIWKPKNLWMPFLKFFKKVTIELSSGLPSHEYLVLALSVTTIKPDFYSIYYGVV